MPCTLYGNLDRLREAGAEVALMRILQRFDRPFLNSLESLQYFSTAGPFMRRVNTIATRRLAAKVSTPSARGIELLFTSIDPQNVGILEYFGSLPVSTARVITARRNTCRPWHNHSVWQRRSGAARSLLRNRADGTFRIGAQADRDARHRPLKRIKAELRWRMHQDVYEVGSAYSNKDIRYAMTSARWSSFFNLNFILLRTLDSPKNSLRKALGSVM